MPHPTRHAVLALAVVTSLPLQSCISQTPKAANLQAAWRQTPYAGTLQWNREPLLSRLLPTDFDHWSRPRVLALLGDPGFSTLDPEVNTRSDIYRLSSDNHQVFVIDYAADQTVASDRIEDSPCRTTDDYDSSASISLEALNRAGLLQSKERRYGGYRFGYFRKALGSPGTRDTSTDTAGNQVWFHYSETWRILDHPGQFFIVEGHAPYTSVRKQLNLDPSPLEPHTPPPPGALDHLDALGWSLISTTPNCLPPR